MEKDVKEYKGFEILDRKFVSDVSSDVIYLKHKKTGLQIVHLLNDDRENLCAFSFRTIPTSSTGVPHIIEHSVLCGSEKYPVRDPFINLENQSINTYLNALTGPDKTMYPVSSVVEEDYFNLFSVYADSVFFPLLKKEAFMQEGWHLEKDEKGEYSIQGVVYNEMKGCYSSFANVAYDIISDELLEGSVFIVDHGGNPLEISNLTYEEYLEFYKRHYRPDNCLLFLYGNIPTEKQLDFIQENFLDRIEKKIEQDPNYFPPLEKTPYEVLKETEFNKYDKLRRIEAIAPSTNNSKKDEDPSVIVSWNFGEFNSGYEKFLLVFLENILASHDGSPLMSALLLSNLGKETSCLNGCNFSKKFGIMNLGLDFVKKRNAEKVYDLIMETIQKIVDNGIDQDEFESAMINHEFVVKEINRNHGPISLVHMRRVLEGWILNEDPFMYINYKSYASQLKKYVEENPYYIQEMLKKYFIDNKNCLLSIITPSPKYSSQFSKKEQLQIEKIKKSIPDFELEEQIKKLRYFQTKDESDILDCLPLIDVRKVKYELQNIEPEFTLIEYDDKKVPFVYSDENTNGIDYFTVAFPFDVLEVEDYPIVSFLEYIICDIGFGGKDWAECSKISNKYAGGFVASIYNRSSSSAKNSQIVKSMIEPYNLYNRDFFLISIKMLHEYMPKCLEILFNCINSPDFYNMKRMELLYDELISLIEKEINSSSSAPSLMNLRASMMHNRSNAVNELLGGLSNYFILKKYKNNLEKLVNDVDRVAKKIFSSGAIIHLICEHSAKENCVEQINNFAKKLSLSIPQKRNPNNTEDKIHELIKLFDNHSYELFEKDVHVGCAAAKTNSSAYGTKDAVSDAIFCHWFSNSLLWEKIRTVCGAYGANALIDSIDQKISIVTYRDPNPINSMEIIKECLKIAAEKEFTDDELKKIITGYFGDELRPIAPKGRGKIGFNRILSCVHQDDVNERISRILQVSTKDIHQSACRIYEDFKNSACIAILAPKNNKKTSKIPKLEI